MTIVIREGSLEEALMVAQTIPEFDRPITRNALGRRLTGKHHMILIALDSQTLLGFKMGYQEDPKTFYSWLGGVIPTARNRGAAQRLLDEQEAWAGGMGYERIRVKSSERFPAMLKFLAKNGYTVEGTEDPKLVARPKTIFVKNL